MSRSNTLRLDDVRKVSELVNECCERGDDPKYWRQHLLKGLAPLTGSEFGVAAEIGDGTQRSRRDLGTMDLGADNGFDRAGWLKALDEFKADALFNPLLNAYFDRVLPDQAGSVLPRAELVPNKQWYGSRYYKTCRRKLGADHSLLCLRRIPGTADDYCGLYLLRHKGARDFNGRERAVAAEAMTLIAPRLGDKLTRFSHPAPSKLKPRQRQVLRCLLEGLAVKEVAKCLGLKKTTVNHIINKEICKHFGSKEICKHFGSEEERPLSRRELQALWFQHGWGSQCAWADGPG
jgi:hypothetical protein